MIHSRTRVTICRTLPLLDLWVAVTISSSENALTDISHQYHHVPEQIDANERLLSSSAVPEYPLPLQQSAHDARTTFPKAPSSVYSLTETYTPNAIETHLPDTATRSHYSYEPSNPYDNPATLHGGLPSNPVETDADWVQRQQQSAPEGNGVKRSRTPSFAVMPSVGGISEYRT